MGCNHSNKKICITEIINTIDSIKQKIKDYRDLLSRNEALTRYALINPLLKALAWNIEDPGEVIPEYTTKAGVSDYALIQNRKIVMLIEAKALGKLGEVETVKVLSYALASGVPYLVITDGDTWEVYDVYKQVEYKEKLIASWSISREDPVSSAFKALIISNLCQLTSSPLKAMPAEPILLHSQRTKPSTIPQEATSKPFKGPMNSRKARDIILRVLKDAGKPLHVKEILERASDLFDPVERDLELLSGYEERWKNQIRWELSNLVKEGKIKRFKEGVYGI